MDGRQLVRSAVAFGRALRAAGVGGDLAAAVNFARALGLVDVGDREQVRAAGTAVFVRRRDELPVYEAVFERFWRHRLDLEPSATAEGVRPAPEAGRVGEPPTHLDADGRSVDRAAEPAIAAGDRPDPTTAEPPPEIVAAPTAWSAARAIRRMAFDRMTPTELRDAERLIDVLEPNLELRRTRRAELHPHGRRVAPRAMFRRSLATGGEVLDWVWRRPRRRPRPIVMLCDISGSMERHSRLLLRFAHALARSRVRTEAFVFGTRLTRVTRPLRHRDPDVAMAAVADAVEDWSGGTRIGSAFGEFNRHWARRVLRSSSVVIVMSDGWDRGDPAVVAEETARLQRSCHRLIWLNPLAGVDGYQPLAAGMAAAYPFVDDFLAAGSLASLERLGRILSADGARAQPTGRPVRRSYRPGHAWDLAGSVRPPRPTPGRPAAKTPRVIS